MQQIGEEQFEDTPYMEIFMFKIYMRFHSDEFPSISLMLYSFLLLMVSSTFYV